MGGGMATSSLTPRVRVGMGGTMAASSLTPRVRVRMGGGMVTSCGSGDGSLRGWLPCVRVERGMEQSRMQAVQTVRKRG